MRDCPHKKSAPNSENIFLFTGTSKPQASLLTSEAKYSVELDAIYIAFYNPYQMKTQKKKFDRTVINFVNLVVRKLWLATLLVMMSQKKYLMR